jgi:hypothetical protein
MSGQHTDRVPDYIVCNIALHHSNSEIRAIASELAVRRAEQGDLLALARRYASECAECGGRGEFTAHREDPGGHRVLECWECADIRAVIERATKGESGNEYTKGGGLSYEGASRTDVRGHQATEETGNDRPAAPINKCSKCNGTGKATP